MFEMPICSACGKRSGAVADAPRKDVVYQARHCERSEAISSTIRFARGFIVKYFIIDLI